MSQGTQQTTTVGMTFSPDQQRALDARENIIVSAGAGSGKTRVLVEKYFRLLVDDHPDWPLSSVVAITFTRKAAAEMRERVALRCDQALRNPDLLDTTRARVTLLRSRIANLPIQTNDAFFARLLRQFPVESGVDPDFQVLGDVDEQRLRRETITAVLDAELARADDSPESQEIVALLARHYTDGLAHLIGSLLANRAELAEVLERYRTRTTDELFAEVQAQFPSWFHATLAPLAAQFVENWSILARRVSGISWDAAALETAQRGLRPNANISEIAAGLAAMESAYALLCTASKDRPLRKAILKQLPDAESHAAVKNIEEIGRRLRPATVPIPNNADRNLIARMQAIVRVYDKVLAELSRRKCSVPQRGLLTRLDFQDLALRVAQLVATDNGSVRERLRDDIRILILDEFQDTSRLQWEIFSRLMAAPNASAHAPQFRSGSLFAVGDAKQSIYRFRAADVRVFLAAASAVGANETQRVFTMATNYRTQRTTLESINSTFAAIFPPNAFAQNSHSVPFEPLIAARDASGGDLVWHELENAQLPPDSGHDPSDDTPTTGAQTVGTNAPRRKVPCYDPIPVAQTLRAAHDAGNAWRDMVILTRTRKEFEDYRTALEANDIPVVAMRRLTASSEIILQGLVHLMAVAVHPASSLALAAVLGGPFVNAPLGTLLRAGLGRRGGLRARLEAALSDPQARLNEHDEALLREGLSLADFAQSRGHALSVPDFVDAMITRTAAPALTAARLGAEGARQAMQALRKRAEEFRTVTLADALDYFESTADALGNDASDLGTLDLAPHEDKVRIMTIHASKGLEFPIVHVVGLEQPGRGVDGSILSDRFEWLAAKETFESEEEETPTQNHLYERVRRDEQDAEVEERKRLLYVACTRAQNELHLWSSRVANPDADDDKDAYKPYNAQSMAALLERARLALRNNILSEALPADTTPQNPIVRISTEQMQAVAASLADDFVEVLPHATNAAHDSELSPLDSFRPRTAITRLLNYLKDPQSHFAYFAVGDLPQYFRHSSDGEQARATDSATQTDAERDAAPALPATERGRIVHSAIAQWVRHGEDAAQTFLEEAVAQSLPSLTQAQCQSAAAPLAALLRGKNIAGALRTLSEQRDTVHFEFPVGGHCGHLELSGAADAVTCLADGTWCVHEFKTDRDPKPDVMNQHRKQVQIYLMLLRRSLGACPEYRATIDYLATDRRVEVVMTPEELSAFEHEAESWCRSYATFLRNEVRSERFVDLSAVDNSAPQP